MIFKNVAGQGVYLTAIDSTDGSAKTGDAPNITGQYSLDGGADAACAGTVVEIARGKYWLPLAKAETNGAAFAYDGTSTTADVVIEPVIGFTVPAGVNLAEFKADVSSLALEATVEAAGLAVLDRLPAVLVDGKIDANVSSINDGTLINGKTVAELLADVHIKTRGDVEGDLIEGTSTYKDFEGTTAFTLKVDVNGNREEI